MKKPVKQMEQKDFEHMHYILSATTELTQNQKRDQFIYWEKRVLERINYIKPLIEECKLKDIDLRVLSLELSNEWIELHTCVDYYKFKWLMPEGLDTEEKHKQYLKDIGA
jgi:hypothetical protein